MPQLPRLAAFAKKNAGRRAPGAGVCLCAAARLLHGVVGPARLAQLPAVQVIQQRDAARLLRGHPRHGGAGLHSEQARSIPLLYDL